MRFFILFLVGYLFLLNPTFASDTQTVGKLLRNDGVYYVETDGILYLANPSSVTVKYAVGIEKSNIVLDTIRANKLGFIDITVPQETDLDDFVSLLKSSNDFEFVDYNSYGKLCYIPGDAHLDSQWHLSYIKAFEAWDLTIGLPSVKVAVLDSYFDVIHEDIGYGPGTGIPLYSNADPKLGWDFIDGHNNFIYIVPETHGTKVAGIIGAKTNNNIGIAGITGGNIFSPGVTMIPIRVCNDHHCFSDIVDDAIIHAVDIGANIINMSFAVARTNAIDAALYYAFQNNVVLIAASGNNDKPTPSIFFPASHQNVIAVGSIGQDTLRFVTSCYGPELNVVAPGVDIFSTTPYYGHNKYAYDTGTSFAAPQVSGIAALLFSVNPNLTNLEVKSIIESTARKVRENIYSYDYDQEYPNGLWNQYMGYGLVDAYAAVLKAQCYDANSGTQVVTGNITQNTTWSSPVFAAASITINSGTTLTVTSTVQCAPGVSFIVQPGAKLIINGGTFTNTCHETLWEGITVMGNPNQPMNQTYQGYLQMTNNAIIENAVTGITVHGGGMVVGNGAELENNITSVRFLPLAQGQSGVSGSFTNVSFSDNNHLNENAPFFVMDNCGEVVFTNCYLWHGTHSYSSKEIKIINSTATWNGNNYIATFPVSIGAGSVFKNNGTIAHFEGGVKVYPGGKLLVNGGKHVNAHPTRMWKGITVLGNRNLPMNQNNQGYLQITNNGTIRSAITGITVKGGGIVSTNGATFLNNTTGIKFEPLSSGQSGVSGTLVSTEFIVDEHYLGNLQDEPHLIMDKCGKVLVTNCVFWQPHLSSIHKGIDVINTTTQWSGEYNNVNNSPISIRSGAVFTNTGKITHLGNHVTVDPGCKLIIDGGTHTNADPNRQWPGIIVLGNAIKMLDPDIQGFVELDNNAKIENAITGITSKGGGMVFAHNTQFVNNTTGVKIEPVAASQNGMSGSFTHTDFVINANYLGDTHQNVGSHLVLNSCGDVEVIHSSFTNPHYSNIRKGIELLGTTTEWSGTNTLSCVPVLVGRESIFFNTGVIKHAEAGITVEPSGRLTVSGGTHTNAPTTRQWPGIVVLGDPNQPLNPNVQGYVELARGSRIENAVTGILAKEGGTVLTTSAQLYASPVSIQSGAILTIFENGTVLLAENSNLTIEKAGNLEINDYVLVSGLNNTETAIHVKGGNITVGEEVIFQDLTGGILLENAKNTQGLPLHDDTKYYHLSKIIFNNTPLTHRGTNINVDYCIFNPGSHVKSEIGVFKLAESVFNETTFLADHTILASGVQGKIQPESAIAITKTEFHGNNALTAIEAVNTRHFEIHSNIIRRYETGISLTGSGITQQIGVGGMFNNEVASCGTGIELFNSVSSFQNNQIQHNVHGVKLFNNSYTVFDNSNQFEQRFKNCDSLEFYASENSFPTIFRDNIIWDDDKQGVPLFYWDAILFGSLRPKDISYNCWGENFDPLEDLHPYQELNWSPANQCAGKSGTPTQGDDEIETLYKIGLIYFAEEDYTNAELTFKEIIETYPKSRFAIAALHELFALEHYTNQDFYQLNTYFTSFTQKDSVIFNTAEFLATRCYVKEREWQPAVDWYEDRIMNPPSYQDSVFAVIDLGYIHLLMEADTMGGAKSGSVRYRLEEIKPKTKQHYEENKTALLATLPQIKKSKNDKFIQNNDINIPKIEKKGIIGLCTPNPITGATTIDYEIYTKGRIEIRIYNNMGQIVKNLPLGTQIEGNYQTKVTLSDLSMGIYHYVLFLNGERVDSKKLVVN